jgi:NADH-quinone oxidoreductase subunit G
MTTPISAPTAPRWPSCWRRTFGDRARAVVVIVGQGALREADGEAVLAHAMQLAEKTQPGFWSCTPPPPAWARWMWARDRGRHGRRRRRGRRDLQPRRRRDRHRPGRLRDLPGQPRRPGRAPRRHHPAGAAYTEEQGLFVNTEGRPQLALRAASRRARPRRTGRSCARCRPNGRDAALDSLAQLRRRWWSRPCRIWRKIDEVPKTTGRRCPAARGAGQGGFRPRSPIST